MSYMVLARKWRPRSFAEMTGQEHVLRALSNALDSGRVHHAFLFAGTRGVGKTTVARILAKCLNCDRGVSSKPCGECASCIEIDAGRSLDVLEVDAASQSKVDETRDLLDNVAYAPARSRFKIYLIDEVHMLSTHSFNALLKTLEEPPSHVKFLLATTDPHKLPATVLSRCLQFNLKNLSVSLISGRLRHILEAEKIPYDAAALPLLAGAADGSLRDALSLLDQLLAFGNGEAGESAARAMLGTVDREHVQRIAELLAEGEPAALLRFAQSLEEWSPDYERLLQDLASLLERVAMQQAVPGYAADELFPAELLQTLAARISAADLQLYYQAAIMGRRDLRLAPDPRSGLRMTLLRMLAFRPAGAGTVTVTVAAAAAGPAGAPTSSAAPAQEMSKVTAGGGEGGWNETLAALDLGGAARQLASHCVLLERTDSLVRLALDPRIAVLPTPTQIEKIAQALSRHHGQTLRVTIEREAVAGESPARERERQSNERLAQAREAFSTDPLVQALQQQFGASIQPESVRPAKSN
jgi:DNA polymerase-3 subunit gamma/tau